MQVYFSVRDQHDPVYDLHITDRWIWSDFKLLDDLQEHKRKKHTFLGAFFACIGDRIVRVGQEICGERHGEGSLNDRGRSRNRVASVALQCPAD